MVKLSVCLDARVAFAYPCSHAQVCLTCIACFGIDSFHIGSDLGAKIRKNNDIANFRHRISIIFIFQFSIFNFITNFARPKQIND